MAARAYVGLGSNLENSRDIIAAAARQTASFGYDARISALYLTEPRGGPPQPPYCNAVVAMTTAWPPHQLLALLFFTEERFGRVRRDRWGPRTLDCDLLLYGDWAIQGERLTLPHPRLLERRFVLEPLADIAPDVVLPGGTPLPEALSHVMDQEVVRL